MIKYIEKKSSKNNVNSIKLAGILFPLSVIWPICLCSTEIQYGAKPFEHTIDIILNFPSYRTRPPDPTASHSFDLLNGRRANNNFLFFKYACLQSFHRTRHSSIQNIKVLKLIGHFIYFYLYTCVVHFYSCIISLMHDSFRRHGYFLFRFDFLVQFCAVLYVFINFLQFAYFWLILFICFSSIKQNFSIYSNSFD